jgi:hypothetical protein
MIYRPALPEDARAAYQLFGEAFGDLLRRTNHPEAPAVGFNAWIDQSWPTIKSIYRHLEETAFGYIVAENNGKLEGFARSVFRDGLLQLTELFVAPGQQSGGVGTELLRQVFPHQAGHDLSIIATIDVRAQAKYLKSGVIARTPLQALIRTPRRLEPDENVEIVPMDRVASHAQLTDEIDRKILGFTRRVDHNWLSTERSGFLYRKGDDWLGYGYCGARSGPFALVDPDLFPAVLAHAETQAAERGQTSFALEVPMVNRAAVQYLLAEGFKIDPFVALIMTNRDFARFDQYIVTDPPYFL